ncbi:MAG: acetyltransferase [Phycisphaeraceae bacterium]
MPNLVIYGAGGHASVVADVVRQRGEHAIAGFLADQAHSEQRRVFCGAKVLGGGEQLATLRGQGITLVVVAVGDNAARLRLAEAVIAAGLELATAVHPGAIVAPDVSIGRGAVVAAGTVINPGSRLGANVIVNTGATVDHDNVIEDGAHVGPGVHLAGHVTVGRAAWLGIGAVVVQRVSIGAGSVIGAGAVVLHDIPADVVAYGVPARIVRAVSP